MQQRITPKFLSENVGRKRASTPMHRLPQCHLENLRVECQNIHKWINRTSHCHHRYPIARHTSSVLKSNTQSNITKPQRARVNSSQEGRGGETPYDPTIITKLAIHQDRAKSRTQERERDETHSYWYIPSAPRVNFSLLVMETAGMMKMASGDGLPLRQGAGTGSRLGFRGYRGLRRRNFRSRVLF